MAKAPKAPKTPKALVGVSVPRGGFFEVEIDLKGIDITTLSKEEIEQHCKDEVADKLRFKVSNLGELVKAAKAQAKAKAAASSE